MQCPIWDTFVLQNLLNLGDEPHNEDFSEVTFGAARVGQCHLVQLPFPLAHNCYLGLELFFMN